MLLHEILSDTDILEMIKKGISSWPDVTVEPGILHLDTFKVMPKNGNYYALCGFHTNVSGGQLSYSIVYKNHGRLTGEYSLDWSIEKTLEKLKVWVAKVNKPPRAKRKIS